MRPIVKDNFEKCILMQTDGTFFQWMLNLDGKGFYDEKEPTMRNQFWDDSILVVTSGCGLWLYKIHWSLEKASVHRT
jgi:hypothetical protein